VTAGPDEPRPLTLRVNGRSCSGAVPPRMLLSDFLRHELGFYGVHVGCEHGVCGACTVLVDGDSMRSCLLLAAQADGAEITTVEGLGTPEAMHPIQQALQDEHGLQCGFCTPGFVLTIYEYLRDNPEAGDDDEIREALAGNLCRCTGYQNIVKAVKRAAEHR
jgi:aerobic carbon-monoxide dehydrogenase small subunit